jgi:hypothetical protein
MMDWSESSIFSMFLEGCVRTRRVHREIKENLGTANVSGPRLSLYRSSFPAVEQEVWSNFEGRGLQSGAGQLRMARVADLKPRYALLSQM